MKKQNDKEPRRMMPVFATEAEEADWWYKNRNTHGKQLLDAVKNGEAQVLTKERLRERIAASKKTPAPVVALRIHEADLALARKQAEQKGLPYQTYIKSLLHETLTEREKRKAGWKSTLFEGRSQVDLTNTPDWYRVSLIPAPESPQMGPVNTTARATLGPQRR